MWNASPPPSQHHTTHALKLIIFHSIQDMVNKPRETYMQLFIQSPCAGKLKEDPNQIHGKQYIAG